MTGTGYLPPWGKVKVVPDLRMNLLSTAQLWREKRWTTTLADFCEMRDSSGALMASGKMQISGLTTIDDVHVSAPSTYFAGTQLDAGLSLLVHNE